MEPGTIGWVDLTVPDATGVRDFYREVAGWGVQEVEMDGYSDFAMTVPGGDSAVAGVCHARGANADLPRVWLVYIVVTDLDRSVARCLELGGEVVAGPKGGEMGRFTVIRDPAGAVCALFEPPRT
ncbi:MAG: VOC family protein [Acidobacteria bacterium]|nr:VOC family protein [Acidobacteriota bacterium]